MMFLSSTITMPIYTKFYSTTVILLIFLATIHVFKKVGTTKAALLPDNVTLPAVFVFGDSLVDAGNNNNLKTIAKCNFPPYGRDFDGGVATGRYSNGRVPTDMLAEALGVKRNVPAYLDPKLELKDLLTGVTFASGGCGYDPLSAETSSALSLDNQLDLFKEYIGKIQEAGEEKAATIISESLYVVCTGSNDILNNYYSLPVRKAHYDLPSYADFLTELASKFVQELYDLGARRIGVISLAPIGCVPSQRTTRGGPSRQCFDLANKAAILFNSKLSSELNKLNHQLSDARLVYVDIYYPFLDLIKNPSKYGFEVNNRGCCGTGYIEVTYLCNRYEDSLTCTDDTKYVFWDSFHPTEKAYQILATGILNKYVKKFL